MGRLLVIDGEHENPRCELDSAYKANRPDYSVVREEENPFSQLPDVYKALDFLGIRYIETTDCEADDLIAGYALAFGQRAEVVISSFDSDFFQLITDKVSVLRYRGEKTMICTPENDSQVFHYCEKIIMMSRYPLRVAARSDISKVCWSSVLRIL